MEVGEEEKYSFDKRRVQHQVESITIQIPD